MNLARQKDLPYNESGQRDFEGVSLFFCFLRKVIGMSETGIIIGERYRVLKKLGEGGRGSVYLVMNLRTERFWAGKRIASSLSDRPHELEMMKHLKNSHLPQIIDVIREGESLWLIMEYVRGIPFDHYLKGGRTLPEAQCLETALQVCDALCYLQGHSPPVFHQDIKPGNLIRTKEGKVKLVDFGAAWKQDTEQVNEGTDGYAAPEQYEKNAQKDGRTDIYGLGATIYRLVSGKKYSGTLQGSRVPGCGEIFSDVIMKCLRKRPEDRYQSAAELRAALLKVRRRYAKDKARKQILCAAAFALPAAAFCVSVMPENIDFSEDEQWNYDKLVSEARVARKEESRDLYRKAVFMEPGNRKAYLSLLDDAGSDGVFSDDEELFLRDLLHTVSIGESETYEEILRKDPLEYGEFADRMGIMYRYEYGSEDGKRIAAGWFSKADDAGKESGSSGNLPSWLKEARFYLVWSAMDGTAAAGREDALRFWEILGQAQDYVEMEEDPLIKLSLLRDEAWQLAFRIADLTEAGLEPGEITDRGSGIMRQAEEILKSITAGEKEKTAAELAADIRDAADTVMQRLGKAGESPLSEAGPAEDGLLLREGL